MSHQSADRAHEEEAAPGAAAVLGRAIASGHVDDESEDPIHLENPQLAQHFDTPQHQFDAGKLGIWLFLVTEVLFFSGLFCVYAVYRAQHPEIFGYAHYFLDKKLGAANTVVLLLSSLTAAWAVRAAQLGQKRLLSGLLAATLLCAFAFMGVKYVEYSNKVHDGLLWGRKFAPVHQVWETPAFRRQHPEAAELGRELAAAAKVDATGEALRAIVQGRSADTVAMEPLVDAGIIGGDATVRGNVFGRPKRAHLFFGIYFFMTGLHGVHVLGGILVFLWLFRRSFSGVFGQNYFGPVDYAALYWHLVNLIWIYLFPLLYLIH